MSLILSCLVSVKVPVVDRIIPLLPNVTGSILDLNVHFESVIELNYTRTLFAPVGYLIQLHLEGIVIHGSNVNSSMCSCWSMEISDPYQTQDSPLVTLCRSDNISAISHIVVRSHFNVLILTELASTITAVITGYFKITYSVLKGRPNIISPY